LFYTQEDVCQLIEDFESELGRLQNQIKDINERPPRSFS